MVKSGKWIWVVVILVVLLMQQGKKESDACEITRSCCIDTRLDRICIRDDADTSMGSIFNWKDLQLINEYDSRIWHYHGSYFMSPNPDGFQGKGGIGRLQYGEYGNLVESGVGLNSGGNVDYIVWHPTKLQSVGHTDSGFSSYYELEVTGDRWNVVEKIYVEPKYGGSLPLSVKGVNGGQGAIYRNDIDGQYCGFQEHFSMPSNVYDSALEKDFLFVFSSCPVSFDETAREVFYDSIVGETYEFTVLITDTAHESGISDWMENYAQKEYDLRVEYENFAREIKHPSEFGVTNPADRFSYYLTDYSNWFNRIRSHDEDTTSNLMDKEVWTPANTNYAAATWKWDSFWSAFSTLGILKDFNGVRNQALVDQIDVWKQNTDAYPTIDFWTATIYNNKYLAKTQPDGGWALVIWDYYKKTGDKDLLCSLEPHLRSDYEWTKTKADNWLMKPQYAGRDGNDVSDGTLYSVDSTGFLLLDSIVMANIEYECGNQLAANQYFDEFSHIRQASKSFWDANVNYMVNLDDNLNHDYQAGDINSYAGTPNACWFLAFDAIEENNIQPMVDTLFTDFVDVVGLTSIPTSHMCYSSHGYIDGSGESLGCFAGETWDGPVWAGVDNTLCIWALRQQVNIYGRTDLQDELDYLEGLTLQVAKQHPFGAESYNSDGTSSPAVWGQRPYGWGALVGANPVSDYNPLSYLKISDPCLTEVCGDGYCNPICGEDISSCAKDCMTTSPAEEYQSFLTHSASYIDGGNFNTYISNANNWVSS